MMYSHCMVQDVVLIFCFSSLVLLDGGCKNKETDSALLIDDLERIAIPVNVDNSRFQYDFIWKARETTTSLDREQLKELSLAYPEITEHCFVLGNEVIHELPSIMEEIKKDPNFDGGIHYIEVKWDDFPIYAQIVTEHYVYVLTKYNYHRKWAIAYTGVVAL